jgi:hypothetical protein
MWKELIAIADLLWTWYYTIGFHNRKELLDEVIQYDFLEKYCIQHIWLILVIPLKT